MKTKKIEKKLVLNRKTITNLDETQLNSVHGGVYTDFCVTVGRTVCVTYCIQCPSVKCM